MEGRREGRKEGRKEGIKYFEYLNSRHLQCVTEYGSRI